MLKKVSANIFYTCIRYRLLSHVTCGEKKISYKKKYHQLKEVICQFETERIYLLGIKVLTVRDCGTFRCHFFFEIPVWTQIFHDKSYTCRLFGVSVYKKKFSISRSIKQNQGKIEDTESIALSSNASIGITSNIGITSTEKNISSLLEAIHSRGI